MPGVKKPSNNKTEQSTAKNRSNKQETTYKKKNQTAAKWEVWIHSVCLFLVSSSSTHPHLHPVIQLSIAVALCRRGGAVSPSCRSGHCAARRRPGGSCGRASSRWTEEPRNKHTQGGGSQRYIEQQVTPVFGEQRSKITGQTPSIQT